MEVHKVIVIIEDHEGLGAEGIKAVLESTRYPNRCIAPHVAAIETREIGEWDDAHPLNNSKTRDAEIARLFGGA